MDWFHELLADLEIEDQVDIDAKTMNGNPARVVQFWARKAAPVEPDSSFDRSNRHVLRETE
jgi:hypothetical protein